MAEEDIPCVGICLPDEDEAYCIGCGRPWGMASVGGASSSPPIAVPPAPTFPASLSRAAAEESADQSHQE